MLLSCVLCRYLKNVILKLLETGEYEALLPVIAIILHFSPDELNRCREAYQKAEQQVDAVPNSSILSSLGNLFGSSS